MAAAAECTTSEPDEEAERIRETIRKQAFDGEFFVTTRCARTASCR